MNETLDSKMNAQLDRYSRGLAKGLVSPHEFANGLFSFLAETLGSETHAAANVVAVIPEAARTTVIEVAEQVLQGNVSGPTFRIGPGLTKDDLIVITPKLRAWALALLEHLGSSR